MNFKLLFPTFRNRFRFVGSRLKQYSADSDWKKGLNLGTGEGDYDQMVAKYVNELIGCDVNEEDLNHARALNAQVMNLHYEVNNALDLSYESDSFDLLISCEVIEHVGKPDQMVREIARVLRPGGIAIMTFPSREFPFTYDPVNRVYQWLRGVQGKEYLISQGAYAFGHDYLIGSRDFKSWAAESGLEVVEFRGLSHYLVGLLEMYWTGIAQRIFKKNAENLTGDSEGALKVRPQSTKDPALAFITDMILLVDRLLTSWIPGSVGKGVVLRKK
jgi:2-polyprenyl-3-methyl-5-hydroxy-6-metoxy-1,4-benzoquinol methylase